MIPQIFYRYEYHHDSLNMITYRLIKETAKGYWITENNWFAIRLKWIPKISKKRWAYPTQKEALNNYIHRSKRRIRILIGQTERTADGMKKAKKLIKTM
jgi:hypothetical protein